MVDADDVTIRGKMGRQPKKCERSHAKMWTVWRPEPGVQIAPVETRYAHLSPDARRDAVQLLDERNHGNGRPQPLK